MRLSLAFSVFSMSLAPAALAAGPEPGPAPADAAGPAAEPAPALTAPAPAEPAPAEPAPGPTAQTDWPASAGPPPGEGPGAKAAEPAPSPGGASAPPAADHPHAEVQPRHRISYTNVLVARLNPLGAEDRLTFMYHRRLTARTGRLWEDSHVGFGLTPSFAPSIVRLGGTLQVVPLAILHLKASYYFITYFGEHEFKAHDFASPNDNFGPKVIKERSEAKEGLTTYGGQAELSALLQAKFGPIAVRNELTFFHNLIKLRDGNDVFYDLRHDVLAPARGWLLGNDSDLLYINSKIRLTAGVRGTYFHNFYADSVYEATDTARDDRINDIARVGPLIAYTFKDRPKKRFMKPTLYLLAQWWVKHRYRTGQEVSQGLPMIVLGFSFTGDLWKRD